MSSFVNIIFLCKTIHIFIYLFYFIINCMNYVKQVKYDVFNSPSVKDSGVCAHYDAVLVFICILVNYM